MRKKNLLSILKYLSLFIIFCLSALSGEEESKSNVFLSTKFVYTSVRSEPKKNSKVLFVYTSKNEPLKVLYQFCDWIKTIDAENNTGWIKKSLLSKERFVIIKASKKQLHLYKDIDSKKVVAILDGQLRGKLIAHQKSWCKIRVRNYLGWVQKCYLWGV